jgi:cysteine desulfurase
MNKLIYLDHAAATPLDTAIKLAMEPYLSDNYANPSSLYAAARLTKKALEGARESIAGTIGAKTSEIVFTSGATESVNMALLGVVRSHPGSSLVTQVLEHDAVLGCRDQLVAEGYHVETVGVSPTGLINIRDIIDAISDSTVLVSVMLVNNEIGIINPIGEIAKQIKLIRQDRLARGVDMPLYLHTDASQATNYVDLSVSRLGVDLMSLNGSKIYGPRSSGILYIKYQTKISPIIFGGGQERGRRSGTEDVAAAVGLGMAIKKSQDLKHEESRRLTILRDNFIAQILKTIPGSSLNGDKKNRVANNINLSFDRVDGETLILYLDKIGVNAATGSACSTNDQAPSHVLLGIGLSESAARSSLRLTLGRSTTQEDLDFLAKKLPAIISRLRELY